MTPRVLATAFVVTLAACEAGVLEPAALDGRTDACGYCRMIVSDRRFASQIVAPNEEARFFDDLGCLANYLTKAPPLARGAVIYVADHRSGTWVQADHAVYTRLETGSAPMGSRVVAHETEESREADRGVSTGTPVPMRDVFSAGLAGGPQ